MPVLFRAKDLGCGSFDGHGAWELLYPTLKKKKGLWMAVSEERADAVKF